VAVEYARTPASEELSVFITFDAGGSERQDRASDDAGGCPDPCVPWAGMSTAQKQIPISVCVERMFFMRSLARRFGPARKCLVRIDYFSAR